MLRDKSLRKKILRQLKSVSGGISNIIYNTIQYHLDYNKKSNCFEMNRLELELMTEYFKDHPMETSGNLEGTDIFWELTPQKFIVGCRCKSKILMYSGVT